MRKHLKFLATALVILFMVVPVIIVCSVLGFDPFSAKDFSVWDYIMGFWMVIAPILSLIFAVASMRIKKTFLGVVLILFDLLLSAMSFCVLISYNIQ